MEYYLNFLKCFSLAYLLFYNPFCIRIINYFLNEINLEKLFINKINHFLTESYFYSIKIIGYSSLFILIIQFIFFNYSSLFQLFIYNSIETNKNNDSVFISYLIEFFYDFAYPFIGILFLFRRIKQNKLINYILSILLLLPINEILLLKAYRLRYYFLLDIENDIPEELRIKYLDYYTNIFNNLFYYFLFVLTLLSFAYFFNKFFKKNA